MHRHSTVLFLYFAVDFSLSKETKTSPHTESAGDNGLPHYAAKKWLSVKYNKRKTFSTCLTTLRKTLIGTKPLGNPAVPLHHRNAAWAYLLAFRFNNPSYQIMKLFSGLILRKVLQRWLVILCTGYILHLNEVCINSIMQQSSILTWLIY